MGPPETLNAIEAAQNAFKTWKKVSARVSKYLRKVVVYWLVEIHCGQLAFSGLFMYGMQFDCCNLAT